MQAVGLCTVEGMPQTPATPTNPLVTGSEIARIAGVTRAAVSNWRRRYDDFPAPAGGAVNSPLFDLAEVQAWLNKQRKGQDVTDEVQLWQVLRGAYGDDILGGLADVAQASPPRAARSRPYCPGRRSALPAAWRRRLPRPTW